MLTVLEEPYGHDLTDPDEITVPVAAEIMECWQNEYDRFSAMFRDSLSPEQRAIKSAMINASNERDRARYWRGWRSGRIRFSHRRRVLPRFPGQPQHEVVLDLG